MSNILTIKQLSKEYIDGSGNPLRVLNEIDFCFPAEESISIMGRSGSGKSTLLQLLGGLDRPTSGEIYFQSEEIFHFKAEQLANWRNKHAGFVFQAHHLLPDFTAIENILIPARISGNNLSLLQSKAEALLELVGLKERTHHRPAQLSGGEQQRVAIARALINSPDLLFADEPTGNLDIQTGDLVSQLLKKVCKEQKITLITVTHNSQLAQTMDHNLELVNGQLQYQVKP
ncbi:MAG: ABC transporter ATP-binding protein [Proteobacteria bacterium]|nr:ABC transporter ATP-binding protein [Pseudomonadota bacterium]